MQKFVAIGNLTRDPDYSETSSGVAVCRFAIAVNRRYMTANGERETDFFNVTAWRGLAETVAKYCKKGQKVAVIGTIQIRQYEANDGSTRTAFEVVADEVEFLSSKSGDSENGGNGGNSGNRSPRKPVHLEAFEDDGLIPF